MSLDQRKIGMDRIFQDIGASIDFPGLLAFGQNCSIARWGEDRSETSSGRLDAPGEVTLRHELELYLSRTISGVEVMGVGLTGEGADNLPDPSGLDQGCQPRLSVARIVVDDSEIANASRDECVN